MSDQPKLVASQSAPQAAQSVDVFVFARFGDNLGVVHNGELIKASIAMDRMAAIIHAFIARADGAKPLPVGTIVEPVEQVSDISQDQSPSDQESQG